MRQTMDWQQEFAYLTMAKTLPSADDLYNSLRNRIDKESSAALAELFTVAFERICRLEGVGSAPDLREFRALVSNEENRLRQWLGRISTSAGYSPLTLKNMARQALAGEPADAPPEMDDA